jgi:archaemetzincin
MTFIQLLPIGNADPGVLEALRAGLAREWHTRCDVLPRKLDPEFAFHPERQQYHSTEILARMRGCVELGCWRLLGVTSVDLYIPILTFVFGEAQLGNACAVVSLHRLRQEFYGLSADAGLLERRLLKEAMHELGHTLELSHCEDYRCVMAASHAVEWIDLKESAFCAECNARIRTSGLGPSEWARLHSQSGEVR